MTNDSNLPFFERPDLSPFLVHLTRNTEEDDEFTAFANLASILMDGKIRGSTTDTGFIKGPNPATCFMDVPLSSLKYVLNEANTRRSRPRYEPYGIVVTKSFAYRKIGCRPVLYLSKEEQETIGVSEGELWRVVRLDSVDGAGVNWVHEREWRSKGSFRLPSKPIAVLVKSFREADKLNRLISKGGSDFRSKPYSIIPLDILCQGLPYLA